MPAAADPCCGLLCYPYQIHAIGSELKPSVSVVSVPGEEYMCQMQQICAVAFCIGYIGSGTSISVTDATDPCCGLLSCLYQIHAIGSELKPSVSVISVLGRRYLCRMQQIRAVTFCDGCIRSGRRIYVPDATYLCCGLLSCLYQIHAIGSELKPSVSVISVLGRVYLCRMQQIRDVAFCVAYIRIHAIGSELKPSMSVVSVLRRGYPCQV